MNSKARSDFFLMLVMFVQVREVRRDSCGLCSRDPVGYITSTVAEILSTTLLVWRRGYQVVASAPALQTRRVDNISATEEVI